MLCWTRSSQLLYKSAAKIIRYIMGYLEERLHNCSALFLGCEKLPKYRCHQRESMNLVSMAKEKRELNKSTIPFI